MGQIKVDIALEKSFLKAGQEQAVFVLVNLSAPELPAEKRPKQNLSFVIDRSGSMAGKKLSWTKKAVSFALGHLGGEDYCSVVAFDDVVTLLAAATDARNKDLIKRGVDKLYPGGCTNLSGGMLQGLSEVKKNLDPRRVNWVLLLTDGMANVGVTDHEALVEMAQDMAGGGVSLSTFGLGEDFEEDLLKAMAEKGGGSFYYIESPDQIPGIFEQELEGLLSIVAQNLKVRVTPRSGVEVCGVIGYPPTDSGLKTIELPDIYSGETRSLVLALSVSAQPEGRQTLLEIELEYADVRHNLKLVKIQACLEADFDAGAEGEPLVNLEVLKQVESSVPPRPGRKRCG
ncbi:MAG: VWA domain-containing protein, partial [Syntrophomonadaceae bacterium]|nr:VWA domain-containing protein [Syntrophomonadaceae bacterium]